MLYDILKVWPWYHFRVLFTHFIITHFHSYWVYFQFKYITFHWLLNILIFKIRIKFGRASSVYNLTFLYPIRKQSLKEGVTLKTPCPSVCLIVTGPYLSYGGSWEILTYHKDRLRPESVSLFCPKVIWEAQGNWNEKCKSRVWSISL